MKKVLVNKAELLSILHENLKTHLAEVLEAKTARFNKMQNYLGTTLKELQLDNVPDTLKYFPVCESHEAAYIRAIKMCEMSVEIRIELSDMDFEQLIMDEWDWKSGFELSSAFYK